MEVREKCTIFALAIKENRSVDHLTIHRGVEQLAARRAHNPEVGGSSPPPATTTGETAMFLLFSFAGVGLERLISTIHPNPPLSALRFFSLLRFGKTKLLFCSHLNRNADKEGLWQGSALHCFAIVIVASSACNNRLEISIWSPTTTGETAMFLLFFVSGGGKG